MFHFHVELALALYYVNLVVTARGRRREEEMPLCDVVVAGNSNLVASVI